MIHSLVLILIVILIAGLFVWLIDELPVDTTIKKIGKIIAILIVALYMVDRFLPVI